jgi:two-component system sensor histidine kinase UhpB
VTPIVTEGLLFGVGRNITKRKQTEAENAKLFEAVNQQRTELRALTTRLADVQESERQQLGRELHDQIGQNLSALGFNLNFIQTQMPDNLPKVALIRTRLNDSLVLVEQTTERIRDVLAELRPPMLDDYGLVDALQWYADRLATRFGLTITVQSETLTTRLAPTIENALFRIAQEALTNVAKHAQATRATLALMANNGTLRLVITDNGHGFEHAAANGHTRRQHWGLRLMGERAEMIGGQCWVESQPDQGTQVVVEIKR